MKFLLNEHHTEVQLTYIKATQLSQTRRSMNNQLKKTKHTDGEILLKFPINQKFTNEQYQVNFFSRNVSSHDIFRNDTVKMFPTFLFPSMTTRYMGRMARILR